MTSKNKSSQEQLPIEGFKTTTKPTKGDTTKPVLLGSNRKVLSDFEVIECDSQMELFFLTGRSDEKYSHLIDLYDLVPKYTYGKTPERIDGKFLPIINHKFNLDNTTYELTIKPALLAIRDKEGNVVGEKAFYPGLREEVVEEALRKICVEGYGRMMKDFNEDRGEAGVIYTLYMLRQELKRNGHSYSQQEIKDAIEILASTIVELRAIEGKDKVDIMMSPIFTSVGFSTRDDWEKNGKNTKAFVRFNPLVTAGIRSKNFRQYSYYVSMKFRYTLSRYLYKRLVYFFRYANRINDHHFMASEIRDAAKLPVEKYMSPTHRRISQALDELVDKEILSGYKADEQYDKHNAKKLLDVKYTLYAHGKFIADQKRFNFMATQLKEKNAET